MNIQVVVAHIHLHNLYNTYASIHACTKMKIDTSIYIHLEYVSRCRTSERLLFIISNTTEHPKGGTSYVSQCRSSERLLSITERLLFIISNTTEHSKGGTSYVSQCRSSETLLSITERLLFIMSNKAKHSKGGTSYVSQCRSSERLLYITTCTFLHRRRQFDVCMLTLSMDVYISGGYD